MISLGCNSSSVCCISVGPARLSVWMAVGSHAVADKYGGSGGGLFLCVKSPVAENTLARERERERDRWGEGGVYSLCVHQNILQMPPHRTRHWLR